MKTSQARLVCARIIAARDTDEGGGTAPYSRRRNTGAMRQEEELAHDCDLATSRPPRALSLRNEYDISHGQFALERLTNLAGMAPGATILFRHCNSTTLSWAPTLTSSMLRRASIAAQSLAAKAMGPIANLEPSQMLTSSTSSHRRSAAPTLAPCYIVPTLLDPYTLLRAAVSMSLPVGNPSICAEILRVARSFCEMNGASRAGRMKSGLQVCTSLLVALLAHVLCKQRLGFATSNTCSNGQ